MKLLKANLNCFHKQIVQRLCVLPSGKLRAKWSHCDCDHDLTVSVQPIKGSCYLTLILFPILVLPKSKRRRCKIPGKCSEILECNLEIVIGKSAAQPNREERTSALTVLEPREKELAAGMVQMQELLLTMHQCSEMQRSVEIRTAASHVETDSAVLSVTVRSSRSLSLRPTSGDRSVVYPQKTAQQLLI